ncbi:MAG: HAMP domain-containing histidine kinase, partial [Pedobacter sp.]
RSSRDYSGLGLGLFICAEIIRNHQGKIGALSEPGKGSEFWFTLPLEDFGA